MGGPSGHPYHLLLERPEGIDVTIYSYNTNALTQAQIARVENELSIKIKLLSLPLWLTRVIRYRLSFIRTFLKFPIYSYIKLSETQVNEITSQKPDGIWYYGHGLSNVIRQFGGIRTVYSIADSYTLHFYRRIKLKSTVVSFKEYLRNVINYRKHYRMELDYPTNNVVYHTVGNGDRYFLLTINPDIDVRFLRHPHYELSNPLKEIDFARPKIRLLIAGRYDIYSFEAADALIKSFKNADDTVKGAFKLTILGKGWENHYDTLKDSGWDVNLIKFAPDYIEEITKHDIQINPLSLGTGTKGKVLDALANGLLVIGTPYALENIAVKNGESCVEYTHAEEVTATLHDIINNREKYEQMARNGRDAVLRHHNRRQVSQQFFNLFKQ